MSRPEVAPDLTAGTHGLGATVMIRLTPHHQAETVPFWWGGWCAKQYCDINPLGHSGVVFADRLAPLAALEAVTTRSKAEGIGGIFVDVLHS